ncbi:MAG: hypothetical protein A3E82_09300 [Gammaproteobacteria bacterium RIFCSPHIGHO2_12_FULL_38_11]|nr:MAG: hypothetical protein A3E82_09300 [Gammaproteobacteria bacterium RIFCSPHIGHO2_12_FULL_38_11]
MNTNTKYQGLILIAILATISAVFVQIPYIHNLGISSLVIAIIMGIFIGNTWSYPAPFTPGIQFAAKRLLRIAIILYGFRVSFQEIALLGIHALILDFLVVSLTLLLGYFIGRRLLKLDHDLSLLISAGAAICGAAAVLAVEDIIKSEPHKAAIAIGTVVLFGTTSMFLYPFLQHIGFLGLNNQQFGLFAGASVHEVAQVLVTGNNINLQVGNIAVIVKMIRVLLLVPVLFLLSLFYNQKIKKNQSKSHLVPWFAVLFIAVIAFHSLSILPKNWVDIINQVDTFLLAMAMGAIGIETKWNKIKTVGLKPLYLAVILFLWLAGSVDMMVKLI